MDKKNILLVFGGNSFEHDISIITALTINNKAKFCDYNILPCYLSKNNEWFLFLKNNLNIKMFKDFKNNFKENGFVEASFIKENIVYKKGLFLKKIHIEAVVNCCHGGVGENGTLTAFFGMYNIPFSSGSLLAQAVGMDKVISKYIFNELNIITVKSFHFTKDDFINNKEWVINKVKKLSYPVILKPSTLGSSIGIEIAKNENEFLNSMEVALQFDNTILVEKAILNGMREYNVACIRKGNEVIVSDIDKPKRKDEILSFKDKYIGDEKIENNQKIKGKKMSGSYIENNISCDDLTQKQIIRLKEIASKVYNELGLFGVVRIDFIMDNKNKIYLNEINTVPGSLSYFYFIPKHFKNMKEFINCLVENAKYGQMIKDNINKEYITKLI